ncbi:MAG: helix-turn-helix domain-containing protein [Saprospiraceae bacterium]
MTQVVVLQDQIQKLLDDQLQKFISLLKEAQKQETTSKEWLTSKEVCELLKISHTTLHDWSKKGIILKHRIGNRIRFRHDEVLESLTRIEAKNRIK